MTLLREFRKVESQSKNKNKTEDLSLQLPSSHAIDIESAVEYGKEDVSFPKN